eukprot:TRINITY_DN45970_c0_g1_i1.p1 TRINITY_DN45970_c0_g1~~TRINITY_DN45970_c0_g1_i1.p1  ORF type:complete len:579 (-),score=102.79 TRINITY_DN45970_c0_g1_i1:236-1972(-)
MTSRPGAKGAAKSDGGCSTVDAVEAFRGVLRSDVLKLHELAAGARSGGHVAARRAEAPPVESQLREATAASGDPALLRDGRWRTAGPAVAHGALLELLLEKAMEAALCSLEDTDDGSENSLMAKAIETLPRGKSSALSLVGPLVAVVARVRKLHERCSRLASAQKPAVPLVPCGSSSGLKRQASSAAISAPPKKPAAPKRQDAAAQTDLPVTALVPKTQRCATTQTIKTDGETAKKQTDIERAPVPSVVKASSPRRVDTCSSAVQTEVAQEPQQSHVTVQTSPRLHCTHEVATQAGKIDSRDTCCQTDAPIDATPSDMPSNLSGAANTVRILRLSRRQRQLEQSKLQLKSDEASPNASPTPVEESEDKATQRAKSTEPPKASSRRMALPPRQEVPAAASDPPSRERAVSDTAPLRCPAGHCLQWFRERRRLARRSDATEAQEPASENYVCHVCRGSASMQLGFHTCTLCFRDNGVRHIVCDQCSKKRSVADAGNGGSGDLGRMRQSSSAGMLPRAEERSAAASRRLLTTVASEWALVSSASSMVSSASADANVQVASKQEAVVSSRRLPAAGRKLQVW